MPLGYAADITVQDVLYQLEDHKGLSPTRRRDLRSAVRILGKLMGENPLFAAINTAKIRQVLETAVPSRIGLSRKRWTNLRSDLTAALEVSGLIPIVKTAGVELSEGWRSVLGGIDDRRITHGLSRFSRWASLHKIEPQKVDDRTIDLFLTEIDMSTLVRTNGNLRRSVASAWNKLARHRNDLRTVGLPLHKNPSERICWEDLPPTFREEAERYLTWCRGSAFEDTSRDRPLAERTIRLQKNYIHSAASALVHSGRSPGQIKSLATLVEIESFKALLRQRYQHEGNTLTAYTHGLAGALITLASSYLKVPPQQLSELKRLRRKLGSLPSGLTSKNQSFLRQFNNPRLIGELVRLPDKIWQRCTRELKTSRRSFIELQSAIAIDLLLHFPLRMGNLAALRFDKHLHWPRGPGKPALGVFGPEEVKNRSSLEFEIETTLADRLLTYRNDIAPRVTGRRPDALFVTWDGTPRKQSAVTVAIEKLIRRHLGLKMTPHQFRHLMAKLHLDADPGAYESVRQLLGHKNFKTTTNFYAGLDTMRAGRAHAELVAQLRTETVPQRGSDRNEKR